MTLPPMRSIHSATIRSGDASCARIGSSIEASRQDNRRICRVDLQRPAPKPAANQPDMMVPLLQNPTIWNIGCQSRGGLLDAVSPHRGGEKISGFVFGEKHP